MSLRESLNTGKPLVGVFNGLPSPDVTEVLCAAGPDFICIDGEHSPIRGERLLHMLRAAQCHGTPVLVRVPECLPQLIAEPLDAGAAGILMPRISSPEAARAAVEFARYPPQGSRGVGPGRAAGYGYAIRQLVQASPPLLGIQIETVAAVEAVAEILAVPGLDFALIGPGDLAVSITATGSRAPLAALVDRVFAAAKAVGLPCGIFVPDRKAARRQLKRAQLVIQGSDAMLLSEAATAAFG